MWIILKEIIIGLDNQLAVAFNGLGVSGNLLKNNLLDWFFLTFSLPGEMGTIWIVSSLLMIVFGRKLTKVYGVLALLSMFVSDLAIGHTVRELVDRDRPFLQNINIDQFGPKWDTPSFPSAHADSSFAGAFILSRFFHKLRYFLYGFAALSSLSRVYFGMHYPTDIMAGALIGYISGMLIFTIYVKKFRHRYEPEVESTPAPV